MAWTATGGGSHDGEDWIISVDTDVSGTHTDVGIFKINAGITATLVVGAVFKVECVESQVLGTIYGLGRGSQMGVASLGAAGTSIHVDGYDGESRGGGALGGAGGAKSGYGGDGGSGGSGSAAGSNTSGVTALDCNYGQPSGAGGGAGGGWGDNDDATAGDLGFGRGHGGGACWIDAIRKIYISGTINCNASSISGTPYGGDGGSDTGSIDAGGGGGGGGGSGGGGGGCILLRAPTVYFPNDSLVVNGSNGATGGAGGAGGDGAGEGDGEGGNGGAGGDGGDGGKIKIFHSLPESEHLSEGATQYAGGSAGSGGVGGSFGGSTGVNGSPGSDGTYRKTSTGTAEPTWSYDGRLIYQEGGQYKKRMRANLLKI